jgi:hypothetical protein
MLEDLYILIHKSTTVILPVCDTAGVYSTLSSFYIHGHLLQLSVLAD